MTDLALGVAIASAAEDFDVADRLRQRLHVRLERLIETAYVSAGNLPAADTVPKDRLAAHASLEQERGR